MNLIKIKLKERGLTIRELSLKLGVSERMIKYYLSEKYPIPKKIELALKSI